VKLLKDPGLEHEQPPGDDHEDHQPYVGCSKLLTIFHFLNHPALNIYIYNRVKILKKVSRRVDLFF